jgi:alpha-mannosidase
MSQSVFSHCLVTQHFLLYHALDRVDVAIDIERWDGTHGRELRLMVPFGIPEAEISYDVPFGHVVVGQDEAYAFASVRPREVQSWLHASGTILHGTLSSSVVAHDWIDPVGMTERPVLQAILLATKRSCHPKGPWYAQAGNHAFSFSMSGSPGTLVERTRFGWGAQRPMDVMVTSGDGQTEAATARSFLSVDEPNVLISMVKAAGQPMEAVVRCWEVEGIDTRATISSAMPVREVWACDLLDHEEKLLWSGPSPVDSVAVEIGAHEVVTLKLKLAQELGTGT